MRADLHFSWGTDIRFGVKRFEHFKPCAFVFGLQGSF